MAINGSMHCVFARTLDNIFQFIQVVMHLAVVVDSIHAEYHLGLDLAEPIQHTLQHQHQHHVQVFKASTAT